MDYALYLGANSFRKIEPLIDRAIAMSGRLQGNVRFFFKGATLEVSATSTTKNTLAHYRELQSSPNEQFPLEIPVRDGEDIAQITERAIQIATLTDRRVQYVFNDMMTQVGAASQQATVMAVCSERMSLGAPAV